MKVTVIAGKTVFIEDCECERCGIRTSSQLPSVEQIWSTASWICPYCGTPHERAVNEVNLTPMDTRLPTANNLNKN